MSQGHHMQVRRTDRGMRRFFTPAVLLVCGFLFASAGAAFGFWSATASGSASAKASTLGAGNKPSATVSGRDVSLSWTAFTNATSYTVARSNVSPQSLSTTENGTCASPVAAPGVSCTDTGVVENGTAPTNWTYTDTPNVQNWIGAASPASATVTVPGPTLSVASTSVTTAGGTASNVVVANYFDNETVTYCVDNDTTTCPAADKTTPAIATVPATGGTVTTSSLTIPSGLTAGPHTLFAKGSLGSDPTGVSFTVNSAPAFTSAASTAFITGTAGTFTVTTTGTPAPALTNANFAGCTVSSLPTGVTFHDNGNGTATIASTTASPVGTTTFCLNANNGVSPNATQTFTLTIDTGQLVITSAAVSGSTSSSPNLGLITVQRQNGSGGAITTGGALTVNLSSSPATGATFGTTQFGSSVTTVTIASGASTATFWYGLTTTGTPTITAAATNYVSGSQQETITTAPAGLGFVITGGSGTPVKSCGTVSTNYACNVTGTGGGGNVVFNVTFVNSSGTQVIYSATQASLISEAGNNTGSVTINANASSSSPNTLTAAHSGSSVKTSTLTFGPYTLTINVGS